MKTRLSKRKLHQVAKERSVNPLKWAMFKLFHRAPVRSERGFRRILLRSWEVEA